MSNADVHYQAGLNLLQKRKVREALAEFDAAIALEPNVAAYYLSRSEAILKAGGVYPPHAKVSERMLADLDIALMLEPHNIAILMQIAQAVRGQSKEREIATYSQILKLDPDYIEAVRWRASAYFWSKKYAEAIQDYSHEIQLELVAPKPNQWQLKNAYGKRGFAYAALDDIANAASDLCRSLEMGNTVSSLYLGQPPPIAKSTIAEWTQHYPDLRDAHILSGRFLSALQRYAEAAESYSRALSMTPDDVDLLRSRSVMLRLCGEPSNALLDQERVFSLLHPNQYTADDYLRVGLIYLALERKTDAILAIERSLSLETDPETKRLLTRELRKLDPSRKPNPRKIEPVLQIDQRLPTVLRTQIETTYAEIRADAQHEFNPAERLKLYQAFETIESHGEKKLLGWLAILSAEKVLPIFKKGLLGERIPGQLIRYARTFILKGNDAKVWRKVNDLHVVSGNLWGHSEEEVSERTMLAGWAALNAAYEAYGVARLENALKSLHIFNVSASVDSDISTSESAGTAGTFTDRQLAGSGQGDTASTAAIAYALDEADDFQAGQLLEFWTWWLGEGLSKAWQLTQSTPDQSEQNQSEPFRK